MSPRISARRRPLARGVSIGLASMIALAPASVVWANEECGTAIDGGTVVCEAGDGPYPGIRYEAVRDFEVVLQQGVVVDGAPVLIEGDGAISLNAQDGTVIRSIDSTPAVDVMSLSGPVSVHVDEVYGGSIGVAAVSYGDVTVGASYVEAAEGIRAQSLGDGNVSVDAGVVVASRTGIFAWSDTGNIGVNAALVYVQGDESTGIDAQTLTGSIDVHADEVVAVGLESVGVQSVVAEAGDVRVDVGTVRTDGDYSRGIYGESQSGSVDISAGYVGAWGLGSIGIAGVSYDGGDVNISADTVAAFGDQSVGIIAAAGFGDVSVEANYVYAFGSQGGVGLGVYAFNGGARIDVGSVGTEGDFATGIDISTFGDVSISADDVMTLGDSASAISIGTVGNVDVDVNRLVTYGSGSNAITALSSDNIDLNVGKIDTFGESSQAIVAFGGSIDAVVGRVVTHAESGGAFAIELGAGNGDVSLTVEEAVASLSGRAISMTSLFGGAELTVEEGAYVFGRTTAISSSTAMGTRLSISGVVESIDGPAITVSGDAFGNDPASGAADILVASTGSVRGNLLLSGGDDKVTSEGEFLSAGASDFGAGTDHFVNRGVIGLRNEAATSISLVSLEKLENHGLVSLANGRTGDTFKLQGTLEGHVDGAIGVDLDLHAGTADLIEVQGLSGTNVLRMNFVGGGSGLGLKGVRVLTTATDGTGDELVLDSSSQTRGFVGFRVEYDGFGDWFLESDLTDSAYLAGALPAGVRDLWKTGVDSVSSHLLATRSDAVQDGAWVQLVGGDFDGDSHLSHAQGSRDLAWQGSQSGIQLGVEKSFGGWKAGFTGGYGTARMDLGGAERSSFDSLNLGLYANYTRNGWYTGAVLRGDMLDMRTDWQSIGLEYSGDGSVLGLSLEGGRRFPLGERAWIEPKASLAWINVTLPAQEAAYGDIHWEDGSTMTGELGLTMGASEGWLGLPMRPYLSMSVTREFSGADETIFDLNTEEVRVNGSDNRTHGRFAGGLSYKLGRFDLYAEVDTRLGDMEGVSGRMGAHISF